MGVEIKSDFGKFNKDIELVIANLSSLTTKLEEIKTVFSSVNITKLTDAFDKLTPASDNLGKAFDKLEPKTIKYNDTLKENNRSLRASTRTTVAQMSALTDTIIANKGPVKQLATTFKTLGDKLAGSDKNMSLISRRFSGIAANSGKLRGELLLARNSARDFATALQTAIGKLDVGGKITAFKNQLAALTGEVRRTVENLGSLRRATGLSTFTNTNKSIAEGNRRLKEFNAHLSRTASNTRMLMHMAIYKIFSRISIHVRQSIKDLNDFEKALQEVYVVAGGNADIASLDKDIRKLSETFGVLKTDISEAVYQIISLRYAKADNALRIMKDMLTASVALKTDLASTVEIVAGAYNNYGAALGNTNLILAQFHRTIQLGKVRLKELKNIMGTVLPTAHKLGVSMGEVNAMFATFTIKGMSASRAGTQIRSLLVSLLKPSESLKVAYEKLGFASGPQALKMYGLINVLKKLNEHFKGHSQELAKALGRQRSITAFLSLSADGFRAYSEAVNAGRKAIENFNAVKVSPLESQAKKYDKIIEELRNNFEQNFTKPFRDAVIALSDYLKPVSKSLFNLIKIMLMFGAPIYIFNKLGKAIYNMSLRMFKLDKTQTKVYSNLRAGLKSELLAYRTRDTITRKYGKTLDQLGDTTKRMVLTTKQYGIVSDKSYNAAIWGSKRLGTIIRTTAIRGKIAMLGLASAIRTVSLTLKAAIASTLIGAAIAGIMYAIERLISSFFTLDAEMDKLAKNSRVNFEKIQNSNELAMENIKNDSLTVIKDIRIAWKDSINTTVANINSLRGNTTAKEYAKDFAKSMKESVNLVDGAINTSLSSVRKYITKTENLIKRLQTSLEKSKNTFKSVFDKAFDKITIAIDMAVNKKAYNKLKKEIRELNKTDKKLKIDTEKELKKLVKERSLKSAELGRGSVDVKKLTADIKKLKQEFEDKLKESATQRKALILERKKLDLFITKKVPSMYDGLNLYQTTKGLAYANELIKKGFDYVKKETPDFTVGNSITEANKTLDKIQQIEQHLQSVIAKAKFGGVDTKELTDYAEMLKGKETEYKEHVLKLTTIANANAKKAEKKILILRTKFNDAYESKSIETLKTIMEGAKDALSGKELQDFKKGANQIILNLERDKELTAALGRLETLQGNMYTEIKAIRVQASKDLLQRKQFIDKAQLKDDITQKATEVVRESSLSRTGSFFARSNLDDIINILREASGSTIQKEQDIKITDKIIDIISGKVGPLKDLLKGYEGEDKRPIKSILDYLINSSKNKALTEALINIKNFLENSSKQEKILEVQQKAETDKLNNPLKEETVANNLNVNTEIRDLLKNGLSQPTNVASNINNGVHNNMIVKTDANKQNTTITLDDNRTVNVELKLDESVLSRVIQKIGFEQPEMIYAT